MILRKWGMLGALLAVNGIALALVAWELGAPHTDIEPMQVPANADLTFSIEPLPLPFLTAQPALVIAERSLFVPGRHATAPPPPPPYSVIMPVVSSIASSLTLLGTVGGAGDRIALLKTPLAPEVMRVRVGRSIEGWEVVEIKPDRVMLQSGDRQEEVKLLYGGDTTSAYTPPLPTFLTPLAPPIPGNFTR